MKVVSFLNEENKRLYNVNLMKQILGVSKSKIQRELKRNNFSSEATYNNQFLYSQNILFTLMEKILIEKLEKLND